ncbi:tRNA pseudouridine(13) synthase TruD [Rodentibacter pneumotropicus]|uniref:tRNA pseudouridine(13) synthase TruD n=1 Tax=Rodentibacter pneumotropicus TaxID=758 RepID=UPI00036BE9FF|nr:tRNA pseudouridine(13) synthase TruD [Rodentibacter pneumotropicus]NBH75895.1 tRNA pseudouridine(13) synthase TruD [Rodentibacter pneumotropicus]OOF62278.1 tRNA pseudouridine(13) synthase TruD [Rodentibacter pneumotropicus]THA04638.1 tRNA pseudouridine(13) synthase TruD [Rodentibacter pneumotropicus]THA06273.1 tRNA pseudouridine(13) synthase TruD [Rodentibacter pneumotropicus]THA12152.1 tRNA pseudouridine(13) synthase TruD [Rodentibacter pneumotropicus]
MLEQLPYLTLKTPPKSTALLKQQCADFVVKEDLGYEMSGEGEFVALKVRKTACNTLFVGEKLAKFAGVSERNMGYAGLKDRQAITEQWFCLQMPGQETPDFSQFVLEGIEILEVTRHHRKIRTGSLQGNYFEILLRDAQETDELKARLNFVANFGFPNYFMEQRFGRDGHNLTQALRWAQGEIKVKDRKKRSFYLSAARSEIFNLVAAARIEQNLAQQVLLNDIVQLKGSHSWFKADESEDLNALQVRLNQQDILLTAPLIGEENLVASAIENDIVEQHNAFSPLMKQEKMKAARRPLLMQAQGFQWQFVEEGLKLSFYLPAGSYATALIRELVNYKEA